MLKDLKCWLSLLLALSAVSSVRFADASDAPVLLPTDFCAQEINATHPVPANLLPTVTAPTPKVVRLGDDAIVLEYPSIFDVHSRPDPSRPLRSQSGNFQVSTILQDIEPFVDESAYDFVLMYSLQELPGWIHAGNQWNGAPAKNIGQTNSTHGHGQHIGAWTRLRGTPHMNSVDLYADWEIFQGSEARTLVPIHEMGHYWQVYWSRASNGPREWRPGDPIAYLAGASYHWSWNWVDTLPGPEAPPGIMYSAPLSYTFNEFDLYAMGLMTHSELSGVSHTIYECAPPDYSVCTPGEQHQLKFGHLLESLALAGPRYHAGDGLRIPATDPAARQINTLLVLIKGEDETLTDPEMALMRSIAADLPGAWSVATRGRSQMSTGIRDGLLINAGLNDAWYDPRTDGQGFVTVVFPGLHAMFLAWFTFDTERPPEDVRANFGEAGHRWLTALGPFEGDTAILEVYLTEGGVFDSPEPATTTGDPIGAITVTWTDCDHAVLRYDIDPPGVSGEIPLVRVASDNSALCEALGERSPDPQSMQ